MKKPLNSLFIIVAGCILGFLISKLWNQDSCDKKGLGQPIPFDIEDSLYSYGTGKTSLFKLKSGGKPIDANLWTINMTDWINFLHSLAKTNDSIIIYPAMQDGSTSIDYLISIIPGDLSTMEPEYYLINKNFNYNEFKDVGKLSKLEAEPYYRRYISTVMSIEYGEVAYNNKPSRVYSAIELIGFLRMNGVKKDQPQSYMEWKFSIKGSVINQYIAGEIQDYWPKENEGLSSKDYQMGFTTMFKVYNAENQSSSAFEIGRPCPPRCGELSY